MVAEHDDHRRLVALGEIIYKPLKSFIRFLHEGQIHVCLRILSFHVPGEPYFLVKIRVWDRIAAVVLHGHIKEEQLVIRICLLLDILGDDLKIAQVTDIISKFIPAFVGADIHEIAEAHVVVADAAVPVLSRVRVHGNRCVSLIPHRADHGADARIYIELISHTSSRHQIHRVTDQKFKLRVAGHGTKYRHAELSFYGVLRQAVEKREIIDICRKISVHRQIGKTLVHDTDNIRRLDRVPGRHHCSSLPIPLLLTVHIFVADFLDLRLGVTSRRFLYQIFDRDCGGQDIAILCVGGRRIPKVYLQRQA